MDADTENAVSQVITEQMTLLEALHEIAAESHDADAVRRAVAGLTHTRAGIAYLATHPVTI